MELIQLEQVLRNFVHAGIWVTSCQGGAVVATELHRPIGKIIRYLQFILIKDTSITLKYS